MRGHEQVHQETTENGRQQEPEPSRDATRFVGQANGRRSTERDEYVVAQRRAGYTLQEIADDLGVSRERVRQLCERAGIAELHSAGDRNRLDPIAVLRFARSPECRSLKDAAAHFGAPPEAVGRMVRHLGAAVALRRLYRWRRRAEKRRRIIAQLREFYETHGRAPTSDEMAERFRVGVPYGMDCVDAFGSIREAWRRAGLPPRPAGYHGHLSRATRPSA